MWNLRIEGSPTSTQYFFAPVYAFVFEQLGYLQRRIDSADRAYRRNLEFLIKLQAARLKVSSPPLRSPKPFHNPNPLRHLLRKLALFLQIRFPAQPPPSPTTYQGLTGSVR